MSEFFPIVDQHEIADSELTEKKPSIATNWLVWQSKMISGVIQGAVYVPDKIEKSCALALWPQSASTEQLLVEMARKASENNIDVHSTKHKYGSNSQRVCDVVSSRIFKDGKLTAIVSLALTVRSEAQLQAVLQLVQWGGVWLDTLFEKEQQFVEKQHEYVLALSSSIARQTCVTTAAMEAVNQLEKTTICSRVSIGIRAELNTKLRAISNTPDFDSSSHLVYLIQNAMEESIDQSAVISTPSYSKKNIVLKAHSELTKFSGTTNTLTIPLEHNGEHIGAITFERDNDIPFDEPTTRFLKSIIKLLSATISHKIQIEKPIHQKILTDFVQLGTKQHRRGISSLAIATVTTACLIFLSNITHSTYTIKAPSIIEGSARQLIASPMNGYIQKTSVRVGDTVKAGQSMATLDNQRLLIEKQRFISEKEQITQRYQTAIASQNKGDMAALAAKVNQIESDIELVNVQLLKTKLQAPFKGVVLSGDLSQSLGSPVELGQVLFEVAPLNQYRVILEVPERNIQHIELGQHGQLMVTALPESEFKFTVASISPLASAKRNGNVFVVEANLEKSTTSLLPGMSGLAKIETVKKSIWWILTHRLTEKLTLMAWSLGIT